MITDLFQSRLDFARKLVPTVHTLLIAPESIPKVNAEQIKKAADGPVKLAMECTGVESSIHNAIYVWFSFAPLQGKYAAPMLKYPSQSNSEARYLLLVLERMNRW